MIIPLSIDVLPRQRGSLTGATNPPVPRMFPKGGPSPESNHSCSSQITCACCCSRRDRIATRVLVRWFFFPLFIFSRVFFSPQNRHSLAAWVNISTTRVLPMSHSVNAPETSPNGPNRPKRLVPKGRLSVSTIIGNRARVHAFYRPLGLLCFHLVVHVV